MSLINATTGKRPSNGCHGKYGPLSRASSPFLPLFSPFCSTALCHPSPRLSYATLSDFLSLRLSFPPYLLLLFPPIQPFSYLISLSPSPLFPPSPIFPSRHSGLPKGSRQAMNAAQNKATFNASWQADWAAPGTAARHNIMPHS